MVQFIEVTRRDNGKKEFVNVSHIISVIDGDILTAATKDDGYTNGAYIIPTKSDYETLKSAILGR